MKKMFALTLMLLVSVMIAGTALASEAKPKEDRRGILIASFGTSMPEAKKAIANLVDSAKAAFPDTEVRVAYTSNIIRKKIAREQNVVIPTPAEALAQMNDEGFTHVCVMPMHIIPGEEYDDIASLVNGFAQIKGKYGFKELKLEYGIERTNASLFDWARQGVLLLNPILTVEAGRPMSHARLGWERLTDRLVERINALPHRVVFLLWGRPAQQKRRLIDEGRHAVLACNHPSPLSAARGAHPFLGSGCFRRANQLLEESGEAPIDWIGLSVKPANSSSSGFSGTESSVEMSLF